MTKRSDRTTKPSLRDQAVYHPKTTDAKLTAFRRAAGSVRLLGPVPSHKFLDEPDERVTPRARD